MVVTEGRYRRIIDQKQRGDMASNSVGSARGMIRQSKRKRLATTDAEMADAEDDEVKN